jgi:AcrR family transcriptional regulator
MSRFYFAILTLSRLRIKISAMTETTYHHGDLKNALIQAGVEILAEEGLGGLSLRKVAKQAGVSHAAPYAHFKDKQALIAAISTEGFKRLYLQIQNVLVQYADHPDLLLLETAWAYCQFALNETDSFKLMFSSVLEKEKDYPDFVEASKKSFSQLLEIVKTSQASGVLKQGSADLLAVGVWSAVHGFISLFLEGQVSSSLSEGRTVKELLDQILNYWKA